MPHEMTAPGKAVSGSEMLGKGLSGVSSNKPASAFTEEVSVLRENADMCFSALQEIYRRLEPVMVQGGEEVGDDSPERELPSYIEEIRKCRHTIERTLSVARTIIRQLEI